MTYDTLYTTFLHDKLIKRLCNVIDFVFECRKRTQICISKTNVAYWGKQSKDNVAFSKSTSKTYLKHLIQNCYFIVDYSLVIQKAGIPVRIDAVSFGQTSFYTRMKTNTCLNFFQMVN